jgi:hypothetical protein
MLDCEATYTHTFAASAQPMPLVAPRTRTFLYCKEDILLNLGDRRNEKVSRDVINAKEYKDTG